MYAKAAELEYQYFEQAKEHVRQKVEGKLSDRALDIITYNLTKPLLMVAGRHIFLEQMTTVDSVGDLNPKTATVGYVPYAVLFGSASFVHDTDIIRIAKTEPSHRVKDILSKAEKVRSHTDSRRLLGCVFTGADVMKLASTIEDVSEQLQKALEGNTDNTLIRVSGSPVVDSALTIPDQKVEYVRLIKEAKLPFYGYSSLINGSGTRYNLVFHAFSDHSHSYLPADEQESVIDIYNLGKHTEPRPKNVADYSVKKFPWKPSEWDSFPESEVLQLVGGLLYANQLVYATDVKDFNFTSLTSAISAAVS